MIIHIIGQENFYQRNFIHFIERNFPSREHRFIFRSNTFKRINYKEETSIERKVSLISLILFTWQLFKAKKVFIHYLPYGPSLIFWTFYSLFSKNLVWVFWGGDIYIYQEKNRSLKTKFYEFFRKLLIRRLKNIAGFIKQDFEIIQKVYSTKACYNQTIYPLPISFSEFSLNSTDKRGVTIQILAGNSADPSNNHLELFSVLEKFKDEDIQIICPLSYGPDKAYISKIAKEGERRFGEKFKPLLQFMPPAEYSKVIQAIDVAIMNHERQQGLGNLISILGLGKKVFVRSDTTSFSYFKSQNIAVWDTLDIKNLTFESFISMNTNEAIKNKTLVLNVFSEHHYKELWSNAFNLQ